jgi:tyrosyl-tRNA synthetase
VLPLKEIARLAELKDNDINEAKKVLATEATALVHGRAAAEQAAETARKTFEEGAPAQTLPTIEIENGIGILNAAVATGAVSSTSEARRQIKNGGIKLNGIVVVDEKMTLTNSNATPEGVHILSVGKKRHFQLKRK